MKKGISPVIATVILIAVTLAVGIAVAAWLMGVWGGLGGSEQLKIYPYSELKIKGDGTASLKLEVKNEGSRDVVVNKITVGGRECTGGGGTTTTTPTTTSGGKPVVAVGKQESIQCSVTGSFTAGATYDVKVYTEGGSVFVISLVAAQSEQSGQPAQSGQSGSGQSGQSGG